MKHYYKSDVIEMVAKRTGERLGLADKMVNETFSVLRQIMRDSDSVVRLTIHDFGSFEVRKTEGRANSRNPKTGEAITVGPRRKVRFIPCNYLRRLFKSNK
jgi:integration host factor subunit beta